MRLILIVLLGILVNTLSLNAQNSPFKPVTDEILRNPDPADWLHWRRTLDGWGYSPLDQINRSNVHRLQLVWSIPLRPGLSQPTPLIYDGVMYIPNPLGMLSMRRPATASGTIARRLRANQTKHFAAGLARWPSMGTRFMSPPTTPTS